MVTGAGSGGHGNPGDPGDPGDPRPWTLDPGKGSLWRAAVYIPYI